MADDTSKIRRFFKDVLFIAAGVLSATIGLKGFLLPSHFLDGGVTGISLLISILTGFSFPILIAIINIPFIIIGIKQVSKGFAIRTAIAITILAVAVKLFYFPAITTDKLLIAVFGGFFLGAGIGLSIRGGAVIDGTEVMAVFVSKISTLTVGDFILLFNVILFGIAAALISIETAMYSMLTYLSASKTIDFIINGIEEYIGVTIVSERADLIQTCVVQIMGRGVTVYKGESGYGKRGLQGIDRKILFCVVTRLELTKLIYEIEKVDPDVFVVQHPVKDTRGGMIKKRPLH